MTAEDVQHDLVRLDHGDKEINAAFESLRRKTLAKGLPYVEPCKSKTYDTIKYLVKEWPSGTVVITNLDTNEEWTYVDVIDCEPEPLRDQFQDWVRQGRSLAA